MSPSERIRNYIKNTGLKQCVVAKKAGYTPRQFSLMMTGKKIITLDDLERICNTLGVPATRFIIVPQKMEEKNHNDLLTG